MQLVYKKSKYHRNPQNKTKYQKAKYHEIPENKRKHQKAKYHYQENREVRRGLDKPGKSGKTWKSCHF